MFYRSLANDRKIVSEKMKELTGEKPVYSGMPRCAYILHGIAVERNGEVNVEADADRELLKKLIELGLIAPLDDETDEFQNEASEEETEEAPAEEPEDVPTDGTEEAPADEDRYAELEEHDTPAAKVTVSFPLDGHRAESICNLVFTIYTKGSLMSKATQGIFRASEDLVEKLQSGSIVTKEDALEAISNAGQENLQGLIFEDGKVTFNGFPETADDNHRKAWIALAAAINKTAIKQKHVQAKETDVTNEKYALRTWLNRMDMGGSELKAERNLLYRHLSGHTAFRTEKDMERWMKRQNEKREILRRLKEGAQEEAEREAEE